MTVASDQFLDDRVDARFAQPNVEPTVRAAGRVLAVVLIAWQSVVFAAFNVGALHFGSYVEVHILGCLLFAAWPAWRLGRGSVGERHATALQIVAWSACAGPFGAFVALALLIPRTQRSGASAHGSGFATTAGARPKTPTGVRNSADRAAENAMSQRFETEHGERLHNALLDNRVRLEGASRIRPFVDVLAEGTRPEKLEALRVVYRRYEAGLNVLLNRSLRDPDPAVRVLAATVIAKLNGRYSRGIGDRLKAAAANPEAAEHWQALAHARLAYAESGLLEPSRARSQMENAVDDFARAANLDPTDEASLALLEKTRRHLAWPGR